MLVRPAALLALDEPTNHLDLASREVLESALAEFAGTIVFISHDRYFINRIGTRVVEVERGHLTNHLGSYDDYLIAKERPAAPRPASTLRAATTPRPVTTPRASGSDARAAETKPARREPRRRGDGELRKLQRRLEEVERRIAELESRLGALADALAAPDLYRDADRARAVVTEQKSAQQEVAWLLREWEELSTELGTRG
jgi:ATP-binding cassette subfamily F protein 3